MARPDWQQPDDWAEYGRKLFFRLFKRIESMIQARLRLCGVQYDAASPGYNEVFDYVVEHVFSETAIEAALDRFDSAQGIVEHWILKRVSFVIRDWVKLNRRSTAEVDIEDPSQLAASPRNETTEGCLELSLRSMSVLQWASVVLQLSTARSLTNDDLDVVSHAAKCDADTIVREVSAAVDEATKAAQTNDADTSRNETLSRQIAVWHARLQHSRNQFDYFRQQLVVRGWSDLQIARLQRQATERTIDEIRAAYQSNPRQSAERRLELAWHDIERCVRRLNRLRDEYAASVPVPLLQQKVIAGILRKKPGNVEQYLHFARKVIRKICKQ